VSCDAFLLYETRCAPTDVNHATPQKLQAVCLLRRDLDGLSCGVHLPKVLSPFLATGIAISSIVISNSMMLAPCRSTQYR